MLRMWQILATQSSPAWTQIPAWDSAQWFRVPWRVGLLLAVCFALFFHARGRRDLWGSHEARAAQNAQRMLEAGARGLPRWFDDRHDFQNPPMFYWLAAAAGWASGGEVDEFAVRLPAALAATVCVILVFVVMYRRGRPVAGLIAALVLATSQHFTWLSRTARIDMPL